eukprot:TRINITY_DN1323_c0_g1_i1.p1 TRINITY_DN1323_c0_g1~~TRINITY_DN1323_c0_g1_i1.p1  ORF type:complete len:645 (-),score=273.67 TRINITY_DN1323_c0_g1_i1:424-2358(-)
MVVYNFKRISTVPTGADFLDIVLSKTQRKTPTVIHPNYAIHRIRSFYLRKVKFASQTFHDRLTMILEEFPILDDIHPFYADLMNVLYDRDHYKLALGQLNTARHLVDKIGSDYCKLIKYGDSLFRCKQLKRAALGRMCTLMKKQGPSLAYLEQVRQHLARLPSIDPNTRTLLLTGFPNVGKSSFLNKVSRANVDVQPYPFTTKSLFVGHTDYKYLRWQVIDTPGILDHSLEERNTIEMQSITALAHLRATILYLVDISEQCGYSLEQQASLFASIKPLFSNKPLLVVANKVDIMRLEDLSPAKRAVLDSMLADGQATLCTMSNQTEEGISHVKQIACDKLLDLRVDTKLKSKHANDLVSRLHVAQPAPRDSSARPAHIPESVRRAREMQVDKVGPEEEEDEEADLPSWLKGFNDLRMQKKYKLANDDWKLDIVPEILDGKNIMDFIDSDILERMDELEAEEEARENAAAEEMEDDEDKELDPETMDRVRSIRARKKVAAVTSRLDRSSQPMPRTAANADLQVDKFESHLRELGIDPSQAVERIRSRSQSRGRKRERSASAFAEEEVAAKEPKTRSRSRSVSKTPARGEGFRDLTQKIHAEGLARKSSKARNKEARKGEADRVVLNLKPKHLFAGKRGAGKTDRR